MNTVYNSLYEKVNLINDNYIDYVIENTEQNINRTFSIISSIGSSALLPKSYTALSIAQKQQFTKEFINSFYLPDYINSVYIYYSNENLILSSQNNAMMSLNYFHDTNWLNEYNEKKEQNKNILCIIYERSIANNSDGFLTYIAEVADSPEVLIVANIDKSRLFKTILASKNNERSFILAIKDEVIYGDEMLYKSLYEELSEKVNLRKGSFISNVDPNLLVDFVIADNAWTYILTTDKQILTSDVNSNIVIIATCMLIIALAVIAWIVMSIKNYIPVVGVLNKVYLFDGTGQKSTNNTRYLDDKSSVELLIDNVDKIQGKLAFLKDKHLQAVKNGVLFNLCSGDFEVSQMREDMKAIGFKLDKTYLSVAIMLIENGSDEKNTKLFKIMLKNVVDSLNDKITFDLCSVVDEKRMILLIEFYENYNSKELFKNIFFEVKNRYGIDITFVCGDGVDAVEDISFSYIEAFGALDNGSSAVKQQPHIDNTADEGNDMIINVAKTYIDNHYNEDISLSVIADMVYMSPGYFTTKFKEYVGIGYLEYVKELRINKAKQLLLDANLTISEIAGKVGYTNRNFLKVFKNVVGETPTQYRKSSVMSKK